MGLDITVLKNIKEIDAVFNQAGEPIDPITRKPLERVCQLIENTHHDRSDGLGRGVFGYEAREDFRAGSYSGYNAWRDELAKISGWPLGSYVSFETSYAASAWKAKEGPFWEIINFSDCEGTIGPKTSAKLASDFAQYQDEADKHESVWFRDMYNQWRAAFEMAAENGVVLFH